MLLGLAACDEPAATTPAQPVSVLNLSSLSVMPPSLVKVRSTTSLSKDVQDAFAQFSTGSGYGAFYVSPDGSGWGWFTDFFDAGEADAAASIRCDAETGTSCLLHATLTPTNSHNNAAVPSEFASFLSDMRRGTSPGEYASLATAGLGNLGASWGFETAQTAASEALEQCRIQATKTMDSLSFSVRQAFRRNQLDTCKVTALFRS